ncbi:MAG: hypothetical protein IPG12_14190 [Saprospiraceae bacterium]|nr:hypothetical protein [Saprospiraceae bacterium]
MKNVLSFVGLFFIGYILVTSIAKKVANNLSLVKATVKFGSISFNGVSVTANLHIQNNTSLAIPLQGFNGYIVYGASPVAPVIINRSVVIEPNRISIISIDSFIDFQKIGLSIADIIKRGEYLSSLRLKGSLAYESLSIPIDVNINPFNA